MKLTNTRNLPDAIVRAVQNDEYSRGASHVSVTQLIGSPRVSVLQKRHHRDVVVDVSERFWALGGKMMHAMLDDAAQGDDTVVTEQRLFAEVEGWTISGQFDWAKIDGSAVSIRDYKLTTAWAAMAEKAEWEWQLNLLAWLFEVVANSPDADGNLPADEVYVRDLGIIVLIRDWSRSMAEKDPDYPQSPILELPQPLWTFDERDAYVRERVLAHQDAEAAAMFGDELPFCTDEDRWIKPGDWAVQKPDAKRATKTFPTQAEAEAFAATKEGYVVVQRKGQPTRCQLYCAAAPFCSQWQSELQSQGEQA